MCNDSGCDTTSWDASVDQLSGDLDITEESPGLAERGDYLGTVLDRTLGEP